VSRIEQQFRKMLVKMLVKIPMKTRMKNADEDEKPCTLDSINHRGLFLKKWSASNENPARRFSSAL
jgi:hypothetical protein